LLVPNAALRFRPATTTSQPAQRKPGAGRPGEGRRAEPGNGEPGQSGTVHVLTDGKPRAVRVRVGITDNRMSEIIGGELKAGDAVIVEDRQTPAKSAGASRPPGPRLF